MFENLQQLKGELGKVLVGQSVMIDGLLCGLMTGGHVLLEGLPGLGKTLAVKTLAQAVGGSFSRIQFTPDLLPGDITGVQTYRPETNQYEIRLGPLNVNLVLADEINRAPAKVQSALLEAMQERQVSIGGRTMSLPDPFLVVATQNPIEQSGTYPLPEAQKDRFLLCVRLAYPELGEEIAILDRMGESEPKLHISKVASLDDLRRWRKDLDSIHVDARIKKYIVEVVYSTRPMSPYGTMVACGKIDVGASPRASLGLLACSKAKAVLSGRDYVLPEDVQQCAVAVLAHRIVPSFEAEARKMSVEDLIEAVVQNVETP
ncbi:MAG: MoxR family ATPase [Victivallales bacterium]|nr:MoxR family ATPase [Victivallales bacterium]